MALLCDCAVSLKGEGNGKARGYGGSDMRDRSRACVCRRLRERLGSLFATQLILRFCFCFCRSVQPSFMRLLSIASCRISRMSHIMQGGNLPSRQSWKEGSGELRFWCGKQSLKENAARRRSGGVRACACQRGFTRLRWRSSPVPLQLLLGSNPWRWR